MNINQILEKLSTDKALAEKYAALKDTDAILAQAKADGFDVTREDVEALLAKLGGKSGELSEPELAVVTGGTDDKDERGKCPECGTPMDINSPGIGLELKCFQCGYVQK